MSETLKQMEMRANATAREHMGEFAWATVALSMVVLSVYVLILFMAVNGTVNLWIATAIVSILYYASYTVVHESVHGSISGKTRSLKWFNDLLGYLCSQVLGSSYIAHRKEHLAHHRNTNKVGLDPDLYIPDGKFSSLLKGVFIVVPEQIKFHIRNHWKQAPVKEKVIFVVEYVVMLSWRLAFLAYGHWEVALALFVIASNIGLFMLLGLFAWLVHRPYNAVGRYKDTATIIFPKPLDGLITSLWLFQNYHAIHHLFPRVPFYRYRQVFEKIEDVMQANHAPIVRVGKGQLLPSITPRGSNL